MERHIGAGGANSAVTEDHQVRAPVVIVGAGPAGLTASYMLAKDNIASAVIEQDSVVGGLSRTSEYKGYLFDIGGHRFFTKVSMVEEMWREVLDADFLTRPRLSRIFYKSKFFQYPLQPVNAFLGLGPVESFLCGLSYLWAKVLPRRSEDNFEDWVSNRFGKRLFNTFFKTYTEKVWGIPCREIGAEWAAQRIKGLSLRTLVLNSLFPKRNASKQGSIKTLIHEFQYPRKGPGMLWNRVRDLVEEKGSKVHLNSKVEKIYWEPGRVTAIKSGGKLYRGEHFISSMPIRELIDCLEPQPPEYLRAAVEDFNYRDFLTVALIIRDQHLFPDNWIYIHESNVKVGRVQNYKNWSPEMVPDPKMSCLGLEYFCFEGDDLWDSKDDDLIDLARREIVALNLAKPDTIVDGTVLRMPKAYPVYDASYQRGLESVRRFLEGVPNLQLVGRNGMHRYNNQDHSMLTAMLAVRNILGDNYDLWQVNVDQDYQEEGASIGEEDLRTVGRTQPPVPRRLEPAPDLGQREP